MAIYKIFPEKDATLYTQYPDANSGLDPILEASTYMGDSYPQVSRYLIKFSTEEIVGIIDNKINSSSSVVYLKNKMALLTGLNLDKKLYFYPISGDWGMGTGQFGDSPQVTNGVSWRYLDYQGSSLWPTSSLPEYVTSSFQTSLPGGGNWYTGSNLGLNLVQTQSFSYSDEKDIKVDVTTTVQTWYSNSINPSDGVLNQGFLIKQRDSDEFIDNLNNDVIMRYFSIDTHTIYPPELEFRWDDYSFNTGSSTQTILSDPQSFISIYNNEKVYYMEDIVRFRVSATPKYPTRTFSTSSFYSQNYYLPGNSSWYAIKDTGTNEFVVEFDNLYTKISSDPVSSYFDVYMDGLEPYREYTILIKTTLDGVTKTFNEDIRFKIEK